MFLMQSISYIRIGRLAWLFYFLSLGALLYTVAPGVPSSGFLGVPEINGARAWINFGALSFQPAELAKVATCMVLARYLRFRSNYRTLAGLLPPFALVLVPLTIILKQPDLGTALVFIPALFIMLFIAGAKLGHLLAVVGLGLALMPLLWLSGRHELRSPDGRPSGRYCTTCPDLPVFSSLPQFIKHYHRSRVQAMFSRDPMVLREFGFQQEQALIAFGSGGLTGRGPGQVAVGRMVPEAHNDMIFALIGEQFGFIGTLVLLTAYLVLFITGIEIASATREPFGRLIAVGIIALLAGQTFLNLMVALRMMPVTGITLPFVSYGGSSLLASFIAAGFLLNIGQNRPLVMAREAFEYD
jgi:rod shape determining protein RodA